ncbi:MAG: transcription elongation factor GreA [Fibrobacteraceae bacterium]|nr:transcription elongation factor GreA [Fibrobacteraceae bacterium]
MAKTPCTKETYDKLVERYNFLKRVERPRVVDEMEEARKQGDLSENAEYHAAKEYLGHIDLELPKLEDQIANAIIVEFDTNSETIRFGATVTVKNLKTKKDVVYQLVSPEGVDALNGKISFKSPIGAALMGKKRGDVVEVSTPKGVNKFEIIDYK